MPADAAIDLAIALLEDAIATKYSDGSIPRHISEQWANLKMGSSASNTGGGDASAANQQAQITLLEKIRDRISPDDASVLFSALADILTELQAKTEPSNTQQIAGTVNLGTIGNAATQTTLSAINTKIPSPGQALAAASSPVVLPSAQVALLAQESGGNLATIANKDFATQATLAAILAELRDDVFITSVLWEDRSATVAVFYREERVRSQDDGIVTTVYTRLSDNTVVSSMPAGVIPVAGSNDRVIEYFRWKAKNTGTGYTAGDWISNTVVFDTDGAGGVLSSTWYDLSESAAISAPLAADLEDPNDKVATAVGNPSDAAASSDTGSFSLLAFLKRGLQNWSTLLSRIPALVSGRIPVDGSGVTQPVSGTVAISNTSFGVSGTLPAFTAIPTFKVDQTTPGTTNKVNIGSDGTVAVNNFPATQPVSGTVAVSNTSFGVSGTLPAFTAIPTFKVDQTTPGTTNKVNIGSDGTVAANSVLKDSSGNELFTADLDNTGGTSKVLGVTLRQLSNGSPVEVGSSANPLFVSANNLPLPTNAATSGLQTTGNSTLLEIATSSQILQNSSYSPDFSNYVQGIAANLAVDASNRLETHSTVTTDEGSFRTDFVGSSFFTTPTGTLTFTNGSTTVTGSGTTFTTQVKSSQYIRKFFDATSALTQISYVVSDTELILASPYTGTTGTNQADLSDWFINIATGGSISQGSSVASLSSGTTNGSNTYISRIGDFVPYSLSFKISTITQRIANQAIIIGMLDTFPTPNQGAYIQFSGTDNTQVTFISHASSAASDIQTSSINLPSGNTATAHTYQIDLTDTQATLSIDGTIVKIHKDHLPDPYKVLQIAASIANTGAGTTNTTFGLDFLSFRNVDQLEVTSAFVGEPLPFLLMPIGVEYSYLGNAVSGVIKASSGAIITLRCTNLNGLDRYIQFFNSTSAPTNGAVPYRSYPVAGSEGFLALGADDFGSTGLPFTTGISWGFSTTALTYTAGLSTNVILDGRYI